MVGVYNHHVSSPELIVFGIPCFRPHQTTTLPVLYIYIFSCCTSGATEIRTPLNKDTFVLIKDTLLCPKYVLI